MKTEKYILICSCFGQQKRAVEAFSVLYPNEILPDIIKGKDRLYKFAKEKNNDHLLALSKISGKFAYYVEMDGDNIIKEVNLMNGRRLA